MPLPFKIMDLSLFILLTIFSSFTFVPGRVLGEASWVSKEDRYNGYDLQKGPVFYEAYYSDDQWPTMTDQGRPYENTRIKIEKEYSNGGNILENIYQTSGNSFHGTLDEKRNARNNEGEKVMDNGMQTGGYENIYKNRAYYNEMGRELNKFPQNQDIMTNNNPITDDSMTDYISQSTRGRDAMEKVKLANSYLENKDELLLKKENLPDGRFDDYMNVILSVIKSSALEILEKRMEKLDENRDNRDRSKMIILRHPRFVESEYYVDGHEKSRNENWNKKLYDIEESDHGINDLLLMPRSVKTQYPAQNSIPRMSFPAMENIFQPRPQIINYVFSPRSMLEKKPPFSLLMKPTRQIAESTKSVIFNDKSEINNHDNVMNEMNKNDDKKSVEIMAPVVSSIEVSEINKRHKIRHHHGEKLRRRDHDRHQIASAGR